MVKLGVETPEAKLDRRGSSREDARKSRQTRLSRSAQVTRYAVYEGLQIIPIGRREGSAIHMVKLGVETLEPNWTAEDRLPTW
jgi:hypothetical protein